MDTSNNQAQTEQHTHVDFSHRLAPTNEVTDSIGLMTDRALGVLTLLLCQFTKGGNFVTFATIPTDGMLAHIVDNCNIDFFEIVTRRVRLE